MDTFNEQIQALYDYYGVLNDNQLSKKLSLSSNSAIAAWRRDKKIPAKYLLKISMQKSDSQIETSPAQTSDLSELILAELKHQTFLLETMLKIFKEHAPK
ncbi:MAG: hypothetical protein ACTTJC_02035 [Campylobacter sp.]